MASTSIIPQRLQVYLAILLANVNFGIWPLVAAVAMKEGFDPVVFVFYRCAGSAILLLIASWLIEGPTPWLALIPKGSGGGDCIQDHPWRPFLILGAFLSSCYVTFLLGVGYTSSYEGAMMQPLLPVVACLLSTVSGRKSPSATMLIAIFISVMGAMIVVQFGKAEADSRGTSEGHRYRLGMLALLAQVVLSACYYVSQKEVLRVHKPIFVAGVASLAATGYLLVFSVFYMQEVSFRVTWLPWLFTRRGLATLAYAIIFPSAMNLGILTWANKLTAPTTVTAFTTSEPLVCIVVGMLAFGVIPHGMTIVGGVAIVCGLLLTVKAQLFESLPTEGAEPLAAEQLVVSSRATEYSSVL